MVIKLAVLLLKLKRTKRMFVFAKNYERTIYKGPRSKRIHESIGCLTPFRNLSIFSLVVFLIDLQP